MKTRDESWTLLTEWTKSPQLLKHALAVEASMRHYAGILGGDPEWFGTAGLLHDMDYERYQSLEDHPYKGAEILRQQGYDEEIVTAILGHGNHTGVARTTDMAKALFAVDELSGFVVAVALVRPERLDGLEVRSVKKKLKDKAFARGVMREDITQGADELGIPLDDHIANVIAALQAAKDRLEL
ncbi:MAG: HDIG domain-containing protein [Thermaerobacter sp.]|nr:HDIG domain-containing protein [Thermaerobacter sp.]